MDKCQHNRTSVYTSRKAGHDYAPQTNFPYLRMRRHKCLDCGETFATFEVTREQMDERYGELTKRIDDIISDLGGVIQRAGRK